MTLANNKLNFPEYFGCDKEDIIRSQYMFEVMPSEELLLFIEIHVVTTSRLVVKKLYPTSRPLN